MQQTPKQFVFKVSRKEPIQIEGHISIWATSKHKARKKIRRYGMYHIDEIRVLE